ncbi:MAG: amino acid ABC transporter permease [Firmicutes bacterium]|nr:amino acid ABC transporter permease [Bacillota bacterium]
MKYVWSWKVIVQSFPMLLAGAGLTIRLTCIAVGMGILIGTFFGIGRVAKNRLIYGLSSVYVNFIRGTPLLVQLYLVYFGIPALIGTHIDPMLAAIITMSVNSGAYVAEIVRAGIQSISRGQMEAARSLGMTYGQAMTYVIIPQTFKRIIPPLGNEFIALLKDSSIVSVIALEELVRKGYLISGRTFRSFEIWTAVAFMFLFMTLPITQLVNYTERKLKKGD